MAYTVHQIRDTILTSIHGRRLGLDHAGRLIGQIGTLHPITDATSDTTGTAITGEGWTTFDTSTDDTWLLEAPVKGAFKYLYTGTTSTGIRTIKREDNSFAIRTTASSTITTIAAQGGGILVTLFGVTSAIYARVNVSVTSTEIAFNGTT